ncbi:MAG: threonine synthase [Candidatus Bathyarchaeia archaeon]
MEHFIKCIGCGEEFEGDTVIYSCPKCGDLLEIGYDFGSIREGIGKSDWASRPPSVWRYREFLPIGPLIEPITLGEGGTSLHRCPRLGGRMGINRLMVKNEGENPTGSFKDRGMTVGITKALELGKRWVACASTGNTSASLAAYAAKAGIRRTVLVPKGGVAYGKIAQAIAHGAEIVEVDGNFDEALRLVIELAARIPELYLMNSVNPYRLEGQKTLAFELFDQLGGRAPDCVVVPVGNAGNISAIWKGFKELEASGILDPPLPKMIGIQAEGAAPIAKAFKSGSDAIEPIEKPTTVATAIRIGRPASWKKALRAVRESGGLMEAVSDEEILSAQRMLAAEEGIFVEPASASSIAGLMKLKRLGEISGEEEVVCVATGHGLKDPEVIVKSFKGPLSFQDLLSSTRAMEARAA